MKSCMMMICAEEQRWSELSPISLVGLFRLLATFLPCFYRGWINYFQGVIELLAISQSHSIAFFPDNRSDGLVRAKNFKFIAWSGNALTYRPRHGFPLTREGYTSIPMHIIYGIHTSQGGGTWPKSTIWDIHRLHTYTYSNDYNSLHIDINSKAILLIYRRRETKLGRERYMIISK